MEIERGERGQERDKKERRGEVTGRGRMNFRVFTENYKRDISSLVPINFMALMIPTERHKKSLVLSSTNHSELPNIKIKK